MKRVNTRKRRKRVKDADSKSKSQSRRSGDTFGEEELLEDEEEYDEVEINAALKKDGGAQIETQNTRKIATKPGGAKKDEHNNNYADEGEASSVASSIQSQTRTYYTLKMAIDEKFIP